MQLTLLDTTNIRSLGTTHYKALQDENHLYFSNSTTEKDEPSHLVAVFSKNTHEIKSYDLDHATQRSTAP